MEIPVTQFLRPNGRRVQVWAPVPDGREEKVQRLLEEGLVFSAEVLTSGNVAVYVGKSLEDDDELCELGGNDETVNDAMARLIDQAYEEMLKCGSQPTA